MNNYNLNRFIKAHSEDFDTAYHELLNGRKKSHWMWYIFPQISGLGKSEIAIYYSIRNLEEAKEYMKNEILGSHMNTLVDVLLSLEQSDPIKIFDFPDNLKLCSSLSLFMYADSSNFRFKKALDKFFQGRVDINTINILKELGDIE